MPEIVPASPAATVVLARHGASPVEVLLMRRHADLAFLAGAYVFPGGRVDEEDGMSGPAGLDPPHAPPGAPPVGDVDAKQAGSHASSIAAGATRPVVERMRAV